VQRYRVRRQTRLILLSRCATDRRSARFRRGRRQPPHLDTEAAKPSEKYQPSTGEFALFTYRKSVFVVEGNRAEITQGNLTKKKLTSGQAWQLCRKIYVATVWVG
jgi:hypothetical protein